MSIVATELQDAYLRALYDDHWQSHCSSTVQDRLSSTFDFDRLEIERAARVRNLRTKLRKSSLFLSNLLDQQSFLPYTKEFCNSGGIWRKRGRSLLEEFALYLNEAPDTPKEIAAAARIDGVRGALLARPDSPSPWPDHLVMSGEGYLGSEVIHFSRDQVDASVLALCGADEATKNADDIAVMIIRLDDGLQIKTKGI